MRGGLFHREPRRREDREDATKGEEGRRASRALAGHVELHRNPYGVWSYGQHSGENRLSSTLWASLAL